MEENSSQLENRVTRLETRVEHMGSNISQIVTDLKDFRASTDARFDQVNNRISMLHVTMVEKFGEMNAKFDAKFADINVKLGEIKVWALMVLGGGILTVIARALHWL